MDARSSTTPAQPFETSTGGLLRALKHRNYQLFFAGQLISLIGTWMQTVAQSWLIYRLTGSTILLGLVGFASQFPVFLFAPLGGAVADRYPRHRLLVLTQSLAMILATVLALLTLMGVIKVSEIFVLATLLGIVNAFDIPTRQSFIVEIVGRDDLSNAIALNSSMFNGARIIGPAIAGIMVAAVGEGWCFLINALSFIAVITGLLMMRLTHPPAAPHTGSMLNHIREGLDFVRGHAAIRYLLMLLGIVSITGMPYVVLMPIFADRILHGGASGLGLLMSASGVGALLGALTLAARRNVHGLSRWAPIAALGFGISLILFSSSRHFWLSAALLIPAGFSMMVQMATSNTLLQMMTPDAYRGRVMSLYSMMFMGMAPIGAMFAGTLAGHIGAPLTVMLGGVLSILAGLWFGRRLRGLSFAAPEIIVAQPVAAGVPTQDTTDENLARDD